MKPVFQEPRRKGDFNPVSECAFYTHENIDKHVSVCVHDCDIDTNSDHAQTIEAFYQKIADPKCGGAVFFAVCRGKVKQK